MIAALLAASAHAACSDTTAHHEPPAEAGSGGHGGHDSSSGGAGGAGGAGGEGGAGGVDAGPMPATCSSSVETDDYAPNLSKAGKNGFSVILLESTPAPPKTGDNAWTVRVLDPNGEPKDGLAFDVYPFMPDHQHGTAVQAIVTPAGPEGTYNIEPLNLFMSGVWVVRLTLLDSASSAELDMVKYSFCLGLGS